MKKKVSIKLISVIILVVAIAAGIIIHASNSVKDSVERKTELQTRNYMSGVDEVEDQGEGEDEEEPVTTWDDLSHNKGKYQISGAIWNEERTGLVFDGVDDYVKLGKYSSTTFTNEVTFEVNKLEGTQNVLSDINNGGFAILVRNGQIRTLISKGTDNVTVLYYNGVTINTKYTVQVVRDSLTGKVDMYVNGQLADSTRDGFKVGGNEMILGAKPLGDDPETNYFSGTIYAVRIYDKALTLEELNNNYENTQTIYADGVEGQTSDDITGYADDSVVQLDGRKYERTKVGDLSLRTFVTNINYLNIEEPREPNVSFENNRFVYKHRKDNLSIFKGDKITAKIRVYNEGEFDETANKIRVWLPDYLRLVENTDSTFESDNEKYMWQYEDDSHNSVISTYLSNDPRFDKWGNLVEKDNTILKYENELHYKEMNIELEVVREPEGDIERSTIIAEIVEETFKDFDSTTNSVQNITKEYLDNYKTEESENSDENSYIFGHEDDDDFESFAVVKELDAKFEINKIGMSSDKNIEGGKVKITKITPGRSILKIYDKVTGKEVQKDTEDCFEMPEDGVVVSLTPMIARETVQLLIEERTAPQGYKQVLKNLTLDVTMGDDGNPVGKISSVVEKSYDENGNESVKTVNGSVDKVATLLGEDENGIARATAEGNDLSVQYKIGEDGEWQDYNGEFYVGKNCEIYAKSSDSEHSSSIVIHSVTNIDKIKPEIEITTPGSWVAGQQELDGMVVNFSDTESIEYGASGIGWYHLTDTEVEPTVWDYQGKKTQNEVARIKGITAGGTYYLWVKDVAGNVNHISFEVANKPLVYVAEIVAYDNQPQLVGTQYVTLEEAIAAVNGNDKAEIKILTNIVNEANTIDSHKDITIDTSGYEITSKNTRDLNTENDTTGKPTFHVTDNSKLTLLDRDHTGGKTGKVISNKEQAVCVDADSELTLGINDNVVGYSEPYLRGVDYGVVNKGTFNFYDGIVIGQTAVKTDTVPNTPDDYIVSIGEESDTEQNATVRIVTDIEARIGRKTFRLLEDAIEAAGTLYHHDDGEQTEITIVRDLYKQNTVEVPQSKNIKLDLNGHSFTTSDDGAVLENYGNLEVYDSKKLNGNYEKVITNMTGYSTQQSFDVPVTEESVYLIELTGTNLNNDIDIMLDGEVIYNMKNANIPSSKTTFCIYTNELSVGTHVLKVAINDSRYSSVSSIFSSIKVTNKRGGGRVFSSTKEGIHNKYTVNTNSGLTNLVDEGFDYYFDYEGDVLLPTNEGLNNTNARSYFVVDLTNKNPDQFYTVSANIDYYLSQDNTYYQGYYGDYYYIALSNSNSVNQYYPSASQQSNYLFFDGITAGAGDKYVSGSKKLESALLQGGNKYYLQLCYRKGDNTSPKNKFEISNLKLNYFNDKTNANLKILDGVYEYDLTSDTSSASAIINEGNMEVVDGIFKGLGYGNGIWNANFGNLTIQNAKFDSLSQGIANGVSTSNYYFTQPGYVTINDATFEGLSNSRNKRAVYSKAASNDDRGITLVTINKINLNGFSIYNDAGVFVEDGDYNIVLGDVISTVGSGTFEFYNSLVKDINYELASWNFRYNNSKGRITGGVYNNGGNFIVENSADVEIDDGGFHNKGFSVSNAKLLIKDGLYTGYNTFGIYKGANVKIETGDFTSKQFVIGTESVETRSYVEVDDGTFTNTSWTTNNSDVLLHDGEYASTSYGIYLNKNSNFKIENGNFDGRYFYVGHTTSSSPYNGGVDGGTLEIDNGSFLQTYFMGYVGNIKLNGGTYSDKSTYLLNGYYYIATYTYSPYRRPYDTKPCNYTINGGTYNVNSLAMLKNDNLTINGGDITSTNSKQAIYCDTGLKIHVRNSYEYVNAVDNIYLNGGKIDAVGRIISTKDGSSNNSIDLRKITIEVNGGEYTSSTAEGIYEKAIKPSDNTKEYYDNVSFKMTGGSIKSKLNAVNLETNVSLCEILDGTIESEDGKAVMIGHDCTLSSDYMIIGKKNVEEEDEVEDHPVLKANKSTMAIDMPHYRIKWYDGAMYGHPVDIIDTSIEEIEDDCEVITEYPEEDYKKIYIQHNDDQTLPIVEVVESDDENLVGEQYTSLNKAFKAVGENKTTLKLLREISIGATQTVDEGQEIVLDNPNLYKVYAYKNNSFYNKGKLTMARTEREGEKLQGWILTNEDLYGPIDGENTWGEHLLEQQWAWYDEDGIRKEYGLEWLNDFYGERRLYFFVNGIAQWGWLHKNGDIYFFSPIDDDNNNCINCGAMMNGTWVINHKVYEFDSEGKCTNYDNAPDAPEEGLEGEIICDAEVEDIKTYTPDLEKEIDKQYISKYATFLTNEGEIKFTKDFRIDALSIKDSEIFITSSGKLITDDKSIFSVKGKGKFIVNSGEMESSGTYYEDAEKKWKINTSTYKMESSCNDLLFISNSGTLTGKNDIYKGDGKAINNSGIMNMEESRFERQFSDKDVIYNDSSNNNVLTNCIYNVKISGYYDEQGNYQTYILNDEIKEPNKADDAKYFLVNTGKLEVNGNNTGSGSYWMGRWKNRTGDLTFKNFEDQDKTLTKLYSEAGTIDIEDSYIKLFNRFDAVQGVDITVNNSTVKNDGQHLEVVPTETENSYIGNTYGNTCIYLSGSKITVKNNSTISARGYAIDGNPDAEVIIGENDGTVSTELPVIHSESDSAIHVEKSTLRFFDGYLEADSEDYIVRGVINEIPTDYVTKTVNVDDVEYRMYLSNSELFKLYKIKDNFEINDEKRHNLNSYDYIASYRSIADLQDALDELDTTKVYRLDTLETIYVTEDIETLEFKEGLEIYWNLNKNILRFANDNAIKNHGNLTITNYVGQSDLYDEENHYVGPSHVTRVHGRFYEDTNTTFITNTGNLHLDYMDIEIIGHGIDKISNTGNLSISNSDVYTNRGTDHIQNEGTSMNVSDSTITNLEIHNKNTATMNVEDSELKLLKVSLESGKMMLTNVVTNNSSNNVNIERTVINGASIGNNGSGNMTLTDIVGTHAAISNGGTGTTTINTTDENSVLQLHYLSASNGNIIDNEKTTFIEGYKFDGTTYQDNKDIVVFGTANAEFNADVVTAYSLNYAINVYDDSTANFNANVNAEIIRVATNAEMNFNGFVTANEIHSANAADIYVKDGKITKLDNSGNSYVMDDGTVTNLFAIGTTTTVNGGSVTGTTRAQGGTLNINQENNKTTSIKDIIIYNSPTVNVNAGTVKQIYPYNDSAAKNYNINILGGTIGEDSSYMAIALGQNSSSAYRYDYPSHSYYRYGNCTIGENDGEIKNGPTIKGYILSGPLSVLNIYDGTIESTIPQGIKGYVNEIADDAMLVNDYNSDNSDYIISLKEEDDLFDIGGVTKKNINQVYSELSGTNKTVKLLKDILVVDPIIIEEGKNVTIDLNGKTIYSMGRYDRKTIENNGTLKITDSTENHEGKISGYVPNTIIYNKLNGYLQLENISIIGNRLTDSYNNNYGGKFVGILNESKNNIDINNITVRSTNDMTSSDGYYEGYYTRFIENNSEADNVNPVITINNSNFDIVNKSISVSYQFGTSIYYGDKNFAKQNTTLKLNGVNDNSIGNVGNIHRVHNADLTDTRIMEVTNVTGKLTMDNSSAYVVTNNIENFEMDNNSQLTSSNSSYTSYVNNGKIKNSSAYYLEVANLQEVTNMTVTTQLTIGIRTDGLDVKTLNTRSLYNKGKNVRVNILNGYKVDYITNSMSSYNVTERASMTIDNGTFNTIYNDRYGDLVVNYAYLNASSGSYAYYINSQSNVTINDTTVDGGYGYGIEIYNSVNGTAKVNILGGEIYGKTYGIYSYSSSSTSVNQVVIGEQGNGVSTTNPVISSDNIGVYIRGNTYVGFYDGVISGNNVPISGTISEVEANYRIIISSDGRQATLKKRAEITNIAMINGIGYQSLDLAMNQLSSAENQDVTDFEVDLLADVQATGSYVIPTGKNVVFNMRANKITYNGSSPIFLVNGTMQIIDETDEEDQETVAVPAKIENQGAPAIKVSGGHLIIGKADEENVITPRIIGKNGTGVKPESDVLGAIDLVSGRVTLNQGSIEDIATGKSFKVSSSYIGWTVTADASNVIGLKERIALAENEVGEAVKKIVKYISVPVVTHTPTEWTNQDVLVTINTTGRLILNIADQEPGMDLALREYITTINGENTPFSREPEVDPDLVQGVLDRQNGNYKQIKKYLHTYKDDVVVERINVFNEGTVSGYASEIIKYLPEGLEYISDNQTNISNGWEIASMDASGRVTAIKTNKLANTVVSATDDTNTLLSLLKKDITLDDVPSVDVALKVTKEIENPDNVRESATTRSEITAAKDIEGNKYGTYFIDDEFTADDQLNTDLDSTPASIEDPHLDTYYSRFAGATDSRAAFFPGEEDDDDAESIMVGEPDTDPASLTVNYIDINEEEDSPRRLIDKKEVNSKVGVRYNEEPKEIEGYQLIEEDDQGNSLLPTNASGVLDLDPVVINYYYKKVITITTKYEDEAGTTLKESETQTKLEGQSYTTAAADIDQYVLIKDEYGRTIIPENASGIAKAKIEEDDTINRNIVVTYKYIKVSNGVIEKHIDIKSDKLIEPSVLHEGTVGTPYKIDPKEFYGYTLVETVGEGDDAVSILPDNAEGVMTDEAIEVKYYYLKSASVRVKYVDESGANILEGGDIIIDGYEGKSYETEEKTIAEYTLVTAPDNASGTMKVERDEAGTITSSETVVTYVYRLSDSGGVIVNHLDVINNVVLQKEEISGHIREAYNTYPKSITGYSYITQRQITIVDEDGTERTETEDLAPINASGSMLKDTIVVNYYYVPLITLTVKYVDQLTDQPIISDAVYSGYQEGTKMEILPRDIDGYVIADDSKGGMITFTSTRDENGFITKDENDNLVGNQMEIVFYYNQVSNGVVEKHINIETDELLYTERHYGNVGDPYKIEPRDFENMVLVEAITGDDDEEISVLPENAEGVMTDELIEVKYYYRRGAKVRVKYQDIETGLFISDDDVITGAENAPYETHYKEIDNYRLVEEPENASGNMTVTMNDDGTYNYETIVIYKYRSTYSAGLKVYYRDIVTNELIVAEDVENPEIISGVNKRDEHYFIEPLEFRGYELVEEDEDGNSLLPKNQEGTFKVESQEMTFWYVRLASVKVSYLDKTTNEELLETEVIDGHENDKYITSAKDIDGYVLVEKPLKDVGTMLVEKNADGTFDTETEVTYYYSKVSGGVIEKHIDIKTDAIMYNETHTGNVGDVYYIRDRAFTGYDVITTDEYTGEPMTPNATGVMRDDVIEVKYYYVRKAQAIAEYRDIDTKERIFTDEVINGHEGDHYSTTEETFDGYTLQNVVGNREGTMAVTVNDDDTINVVTKVVYEYKADEVPEPDPEPENNETVENNTIINEVVNNTTIENETVENEIVNNTVIENETIENEVVENEVVNNTTVENETIENEVVENNTVINEITNTTIENETVENEVVNNTTVENEVTNETTNETTNTIVEDPTDEEDEDEDDPTKSDGVIEKYVDINTDEVIEIVRHKGKIGDLYEITPKEIEGYDLVTTDKNGKTIMPTNTKGVMTKDAIEVVYYCVMKAYVRVEYYNKNSGKKFIDDVVIEGHEGDTYEIEEKEFDGYELVEKTDNYRGVFTVIDNKDGTFNKEIVVRFYYAKINEEVLPETGEDVAKNMAYILAFIANVTLAVVAFVKFRGTKRD